MGNEAEADKTFAALADDGQVQMPLGKTFFSPRFGMVNVAEPDHRAGLRGAELASWPSR